MFAPKKNICKGRPKCLPKKRKYIDDKVENAFLNALDVFGMENTFIMTRMNHFHMRNQNYFYVIYLFYFLLYIYFFHNCSIDFFLNFLLN